MVANGGICGYIIVANGVIQVISHKIIYELPLETVIGQPDYVIYTPYIWMIHKRSPRSPTGASSVANPVSLLVGMD
jgi:hypothetical protein